MPKCGEKERAENKEGKHPEHFENDGPTGEPGIQEERKDERKDSSRPKGIPMNVSIRSTYIGKLLCDEGERRNVGGRSGLYN